jgi:cytochrome c556
VLKIKCGAPTVVDCALQVWSRRAGARRAAPFGKVEEAHCRARNETSVAGGPDWRKAMLRIVAGVVLLVLGAGMALAQNIGVIKERQQLMKANEDVLRAPDAMARGKAPFDLVKVKASFKALQEQAMKLKSLWPEDSKTGGKTHALPAIWTNLKDYLDWFDGLAKDAKAAEASVTDEASFKAAWPNLIDYCNSCHKDFRAPMR